MSPIPDDPGKNQDNDIDDVQTPQFIVDAGSDSDSDAEGDPTYLGYQPLAQDPDTSVAIVQENNTNDSQDELSLDQAIIQSLNQQDFQAVPHNQGTDASKNEEINNVTNVSKGIEESANLWNEPRKHESTRPMAKDEADKILAAMANFTLPASSQPEWAKSVSEEEWKMQLFRKLRTENKDSHTNYLENQNNSER